MVRAREVSTNDVAGFSSNAGTRNSGTFLTEFPMGNLTGDLRLLGVEFRGSDWYLTGACIFKDKTQGLVFAGMHQSTPDILCVYNLVPDTLPRVDVTVNGKDSGVSVPVMNNVKVEYSVEARQGVGVPVDVWLVIRSPFGTFSHDGAADGWVPDGTIALYSYVNGSSSSLHSATAVNLVQGVGNWNTLTAAVQGSKIDIYTNGVLEFTVTDSRFSTGKIGLMRQGSGGYDHDYEFDNVILSF